MEHLGRGLVLAGLAIALVGGLLWSGWFRYLPFGRLPGDISYRRDGFSLFVPLGSMLLVSLVLTLGSWLVASWRR